MEVHLNNVFCNDKKDRFTFVYTSSFVLEKPFHIVVDKGELPELDEMLSIWLEIDGPNNLYAHAKAVPQLETLHITYFLHKNRTIVCILAPDSTPENIKYLRGWSPQERIAWLRGE